MTNKEISTHLSLLADLMELHGDNPFKAKTYASGAYTISRLPQPVTHMDEVQLAAARVGDAVRARITELLLTGTTDAAEKLKAATPPGLLEVLRIKGLGPKKVRVIWQELGVESVGELQYACTENRLAGLKGFGAKTQISVTEAIDFMQRASGKFLWSQAEAFAKNLVAALSTHMPEARLEISGEVRRQLEIVETVRIVTDAGKPQLIALLRSQMASSVSDIGDSFLCIVEGAPRVEIFPVDAASFGSALFRTTGSDSFVENIEQRLKQPGPFATEEALFEAAGLSLIPPALREDNFNPNDYLAGSSTPDLIQETDIRGIIHSHSTWSDGLNTISEMALAARDAGYEYLVISDHSAAAHYANGLSPERIVAQHQEIDKLQAKLAPFRIFKSIEADILGDGSLDYNSSVLNSFDLVIASVHSNLKMPEARAMDRLLTAIENPYTSILGHPTGRLLLSRAGYPIDHRVIIDACAEHNVAIEINANPRRLDLDWRWISYAMKRGVLLSINPDAHSIRGIADVRYGVAIAQKGGLTAAHNLSSFPLAAFEEFLRKQMAKRRPIPAL